MGEWKKHETFASFLKAAAPTLEANEAMNGLTLSIARRGAAGDLAGAKGEPLLLTLERDGVMRATAIRTPPWKLIASSCDTNALDELVDLVYAHDARLNEIMSDEETANGFAKRYATRAGARVVPGIAHCLFRLDAVIPPREGPGAMRRASVAETERVMTWLIAFASEIGLTLHGDPRARAVNAIERGGAYVYEIDGDLVGMATSTAPSNRGARIGGVYTPPELRGRGIASRLVAAVSQRLLDEGCAFTTLYTEKANPTSNKIYRAIGYQFVQDEEELRFEYPS